MLFLIWIVIALMNIGSKLTGPDFLNDLFRIMSYINQTSGGLLAMAVVGLVGGALVATKLSQAGHGILTTFVTLIAGLAFCAGVFALSGFLISGGFITTLSPTAGIVRLEFFFFIVCPIIESLLMIFFFRQMFQKSPIGY